MNLPTDKFHNLEENFSGHTQTDLSLLKRKGFYPYSYVDSFERFEDKTLVPLKKWRDSLKGYQESVTEPELEFAIEVFETFAFSPLGAYHDLYSKTDVLLLADVSRVQGSRLQDIWS